MTGMAPRARHYYDHRHSGLFATARICNRPARGILLVAYVLSYGNRALLKGANGRLSNEIEGNLTVDWRLLGRMARFAAFSYVLDSYRRSSWRPGIHAASARPRRVLVVIQGFGLNNPGDLGVWVGHNGTINVFRGLPANGCGCISARDPAR